MKLLPSLKFAIIFIAAGAVFSGASAQNQPKKPASGSATAPLVACPAAKAVQPVQIYGRWRVSFRTAPAGLPATAVMQIQRHAEFSESVAGFVSRDLPAGPAAAGGHAARAQLAGDLEDGFLTLDESSNGVSITATWNGEMVEGSCGRKVTGTWKDTSHNAPPDTPEIAFTLDKLAGW